MCMTAWFKEKGHKLTSFYVHGFISIERTSTSWSGRGQLWRCGLHISGPTKKCTKSNWRFFLLWWFVVGREASNETVSSVTSVTKATQQLCFSALRQPKFPPQGRHDYKRTQIWCLWWVFTEMKVLAGWCADIDLIFSACFVMIKGANSGLWLCLDQNAHWDCQISLTVGITAAKKCSLIFIKALKIYK